MVSFGAVSVSSLLSRGIVLKRDGIPLPCPKRKDEESTRLDGVDAAAFGGVVRTENIVPEQIELMTHYRSDSTPNQPTC